MAKKLDIKRGDSELKLYFFTVQNGPVRVVYPEDSKVFLAYSDDEASQMVKKEYPEGATIFVKKRGRLEITKVLDTLNLEQKGVDPITVTEKKVQKKAGLVTDFIYGLLLMADKYVPAGRDRTTIKRIAKKIQNEYGPKN